MADSRITASRAYLHAVLLAALDAAQVGVWVATGELPTRKRWLARGALLALTAAFVAVTDQDQQQEPGPHSPDQSTDRSPLPSAEPAMPGWSWPTTKKDRRHAAEFAVGAFLTTALPLARRQLRKRWLARLAGGGHPHPHRALAVRLSALTFGTSLVSHLGEAVDGRRDDHASEPSS